MMFQVSDTGRAEGARQAVTLGRDRRGWRRVHPDHHIGAHVAQHVAHARGARRDMEVSGLPPRTRSMARSRPPLTRDDLGHLLEIGDAGAIDGGDPVAGRMPAASAALPFTTPPMTGASTVWPL